MSGREEKHKCTRCVQRNVWITVLLLIYLKVQPATTQESAIAGYLEPGKSLDDQTIHVGQKLVYEILKITPGQNYEVKLSYPSVKPAIYHIEMHLSSDSPAAPKKQELRRRLNTEKALFQSPFDHAEQKIYATVWIEKEGISYISHVNVNESRFNILLEEVDFGVPRSAFSIVLLALLLVTLGLRFGIKRTKAIIQRDVKALVVDTIESKET